MTEIQSLCDKVYTTNQSRDPKHFIDTYEANKDLIEKSDHSVSNPDYDGIMRLTADYALSLSYYGSGTKALPYLDKAIQLFIGSSHKDLVKVPMYEALIWTRGVENYNLKKYKIASVDLDYLVKNYPDNDKYRNWFLASRTIRAKKYTNYLWYIAAVCMIWHTMVNREDAKLRDWLLISSMATFILAIISEIANALVKQSIKKK